MSGIILLVVTAISIAISSTPLFSQTELSGIEGRVIDAKTHRPVQDVNVTVIDSYAGAATDFIIAIFLLTFCIFFAT